jgi:hypothetical protein
MVYHTLQKTIENQYLNQNREAPANTQRRMLCCARIEQTEFLPLQHARISLGHVFFFFFRLIPHSFEAHPSSEVSSTLGKLILQQLSPSQHHFSLPGH